jgi:hypothetical protein
LMNGTSSGCNDGHLDKAMLYADWLPMLKHVLRFGNSFWKALEVLLNCWNDSGTSCTGSGWMDILTWAQLFHALALLLSPLWQCSQLHSDPNTWSMGGTMNSWHPTCSRWHLPKGGWISVEQGQSLCHDTVYIKVEWDGYILTRFAWWRQDLHAIELLRAHIVEWTITQMLDYWRVMCFTDYQLNWNSWIWIPFLVDLECTFLCAQVDRTRYSSFASGNNCIVQLCKCVSLHL